MPQKKAETQKTDCHMITLAGFSGGLHYRDSETAIADRFIHHFTACEQVEAKLKELRDKHDILSVNIIVETLLAIIEPEPEIKVGDEVEVGKVPVGTMVKVVNRNDYRMVNTSTTNHIRLSCPHCNDDIYRHPSGKCTIIELPARKE